MPQFESRDHQDSYCHSEQRGLKSAVDLPSVSLCLEMEQLKEKHTTQGNSCQGFNWAQVIEAPSIKQN